MRFGGDPLGSSQLLYIIYQSRLLPYCVLLQCYLMPHCEAERFDSWKESPCLCNTEKLKSLNRLSDC